MNTYSRDAQYKTCIPMSLIFDLNQIMVPESSSYLGKLGSENPARGEPHGFRQDPDYRYP